MSYLYSKLPETGVSPHIGTGGRDARARVAQDGIKVKEAVNRGGLIIPQPRGSDAIGVLFKPRSTGSYRRLTPKNKTAVHCAGRDFNSPA